jgi:hypothetical protein
VANYRFLVSDYELEKLNAAKLKDRNKLGKLKPSADQIMQQLRQYVVFVPRTWSRFGHCAKSPADIWATATEYFAGFWCFNEAQIRFRCPGLHLVQPAGHLM